MRPADPARVEAPDDTEQGGWASSPTMTCRLHVGADRQHRRGRNHPLNEAALWGMSRNRAAQMVNYVLARAPEAIDAGRAETDDLLDEILATVTAQLKHLTSET